MNQEHVDKINDCLKRLSALFDDPQPGLITWTSFVVETQQELQNAINEAFNPEPEKSAGKS